MNKKGDEPRSLLRRLLRQADNQPGEDNDSAEQKPPVSPKRVTSESSPVRPAPPEQTEPPAPLTPKPRTAQNTPAGQPTGVQERLQAEEALEKLRQKTAQIANEFAEGKLNRAQFTAMYAHFNERRMIIERMLMRNPDSQAWQQVARGGHTTFLRQHFEARVLAYAIYDNGNTDPEKPIAASGAQAMPPEVTRPILTALAVLLKTRTTDKPLRSLRKQIEGGRWIAIIPGSFTSALAMFSLEPATEQFNASVDVHRDFERANRNTLERGVRQPEQLVFPHRALFEQPGQ